MNQIESWTYAVDTLFYKKIWVRMRHKGPGRQLHIQQRSIWQTHRCTHTCRHTGFSSGVSSVWCLCVCQLLFNGHVSTQWRHCAQLFLSAAPAELIDCWKRGCVRLGDRRSTSVCATCNVSHPAVKRAPGTSGLFFLSLCIASVPKCQMVGHCNDTRRQEEPPLSVRRFVCLCMCV